jgi:hypothetical protein
MKSHLTNEIGETISIVEDKGEFCVVGVILQSRKSPFKFFEWMYIRIEKVTGNFKPFIPQYRKGINCAGTAADMEKYLHDD